MTYRVKNCIQLAKIRIEVRQKKHKMIHIIILKVIRMKMYRYFIRLLNFSQLFRALSAIIVFRRFWASFNLF